MSRLRQILKLNNLLPVTFYFKQKKSNIEKIYNKREILARLQLKFYCSQCMGKGFIMQFLQQVVILAITISLCLVQLFRWDFDIPTFNYISKKLSNQNR